MRGARTCERASEQYLLALIAATPNRSDYGVLLLTVMSRDRIFEARVIVRAPNLLPPPSPSRPVSTPLPSARVLSSRR